MAHRDPHTSSPTARRDPLSRSLPMAPTPGLGVPLTRRVLEWLHDVILIRIFIQFSGSNRPIFCCISLECKCAFCFKFLVNEPPSLKAAGNECYATTRRSRPVRVTVAGARLGPQLENSPFKFPCPLRLILRPGNLNGPGEGT